MSCVLCVGLLVLAEQMWDPLSSSQTTRLVGFIHTLMKGYPTVLHGDNQYTQVGSSLSIPVSMHIMYLYFYYCVYYFRIFVNIYCFPLIRSF